MRRSSMRIAGVVRVGLFDSVMSAFGASQTPADAGGTEAATGSSGSRVDSDTSIFAGVSSAISSAAGSVFGSSQTPADTGGTEAAAGSSMFSGVSSAISLLTGSASGEGRSANGLSGIAGMVGSSGAGAAISSALLGETGGKDALKSIVSNGKYGVGAGNAFALMQSLKRGDGLKTAIDLARFYQYWLTETNGFGGISPKQYSELQRLFRSTRLADKSSFVLQVYTRDADMTAPMTLLAVGADYGTTNIVGDRVSVGGSSIDTVTGSGGLEMRLTVMDDRQGTVRQWWKSLTSKVVAEDGTVGVPDDYRVQIRVIHGAIMDDPKYFSGRWIDNGWWRPSSSDTSLSRQEAGQPQQVELSFSQIDTFVRLTPDRPATASSDGGFADRIRAKWQAQADQESADMIDKDSLGMPSTPTVNEGLSSWLSG